MFNFQVFCNIDSVPRADCDDGNDDKNAISAFPTFPLQHPEQYKKPDGLNRNQEALPDHVIVDEAKLNKIQKLNYNSSKPLFLPLLVHSSGSSVSFSFSS